MSLNIRRWKISLQQKFDLLFTCCLENIILQNVFHWFCSRMYIRNWIVPPTSHHDISHSSAVASCGKQWQITIMLADYQRTMIGSVTCALWWLHLPWHFYILKRSVFVAQSYDIDMLCCRKVCFQTCWLQAVITCVFGVWLEKQKHDWNACSTMYAVNLPLFVDCCLLSCISI